MGEKLFKRSRFLQWAVGPMAVLFLTCGGITLFTNTSWAQLASLKTVPTPQPVNLGTYVRDRAAAIQLGKALFWDMQVGSDGVQACGTCHFHAGADSRTRNMINPGTNAGDTLFGNNGLGLPTPPAGSFGPNVNMTLAKFPFHKLIDFDRIGEPLHSPENVVSDTNDVMSSQGVVLMQFNDIVLGNPVDLGTPITDPVFNFLGANIRRVEPRNTPSVINAVFNFANFWEGRANNIFNGNNPFGPADQRSHVFTNAAATGMKAQQLRLRQSSLASQAVGPPLSDFEMSWRGRTWPKVGKKMLSLKPLAQQQVSSTDSVLGPFADTVAGTGLTTTYAALIKKAFVPKFWNNATQHLEFIDPLNPAAGLKIVAGPADPLNTGQFTQIEGNFALFFGVAVQMYEATLLANDSPLDRFLEGNGAQTFDEAQGMKFFTGAGGCLACHAGATMMDIDVLGIQGVDPITDFPQPLNQNPLATGDFMPILTGFALYDNGFHNTAVRPGGATDISLPEFLATNEDIGRGDKAPFLAVDPNNPANTFPVPLSWGMLGMWKAGEYNLLPTPNPDVAFTTVPMPAYLRTFAPPFPIGFRPIDTTPFRARTSDFGAFKTPGLRNIELTGPYMHNGGFSTLHQVVEFYTRGGDFPVTNDMNFDPAVFPIGILIGSDVRKNQLVSFLLSLTDVRVKDESAPFDHPEIFVPVDGRVAVSPGSRAGLLADPRFQQIPAVGGGGRTAQGLLPIGRFLNADHFRP